MTLEKCLKFFLPACLFLIGFLCIPFNQLQGFNLMPGDVGDARLNNYFLENVFQYFVGRSHSLWHLSFFYPFPYVVGFSDNLFGSAPVYVLARLIDLNSDTAFQCWFLFGYLANFLGAYYALRRLNGSVVAASIGALIFTFALPTSAHAGHAQLHYRFALPLAIVFFADFINTKSWRLLLISVSWLTWQFYAGVYIGFFTLLLMAAMLATYFGDLYFWRKQSVRSIFSLFLFSWLSQDKKQKIKFWLILIVVLLAVVILFYPYLQVSQLYGAKRGWGEISSMLPRPQSYFLADASFFWSWLDLKIFSGIPMRHEHQMFVGLIPMLLALLGFLTGSRIKNGMHYVLMSGMLLISVSLTLYIGGFSLWYLLHKLPLASAIRAITRLDQAFLFPVAYLAMLAIDAFNKKYRWGFKAILVIVVPFFIIEASATQTGTSPKETWRERVNVLEHTVPLNIASDSVLFFAQRGGPTYADELDAMWVAMRYGLKTMNGYSGISPPNFNGNFGDDCFDFPKRVLIYMNFSKQALTDQSYKQLASKIIPIGFDNCALSWAKELPNNISISDKVYTPEEFAHLSLASANIFKKNNLVKVLLTINNSSNQTFFALSKRPIRISWRFVDENKNPFTGWNERKDLPFDIPANGSLKVAFAIDVEKYPNAKSVAISLVQERVFWGHDVGVKTLVISLLK